VSAVPVIETARLRLRRLDLDDMPAWEAYFADAEASRWNGGPLTPNQAWMRFCAEIGHWSATGFGVWAVEEKARRRFTGVSGFWRLEGWGVTELTFFTVAEHRRKGFAEEAARAALGCAYDKWGWRDVETVARDENAAALALIAKLGAERIDRRDFPDGHARDVFRLPRPADGVRGRATS